MNQDQGKPSERIAQYIIPHPSGYELPIPEVNDVRREIDAIHDRLVSAEAVIKKLQDKLLSMGLTTQEATKQDLSPCPDCGHPWNDGFHWCDPSKKQEATKPWCECSDPLHAGEHRLPSSYKPEANKPECEHDKGDKWSCLDKYTYIIAYPKTGFPKCPICNAIPTPESGKLAEIIFRLEYPIEKYSLPYKECGYGIHEKYYKIAEAAVKEFERFLDCYFKDERKFDIGFLKKKLREYLL